MMRVMLQPVMTLMNVAKNGLIKVRMTRVGDVWCMGVVDNTLLCGVWCNSPTDGTFDHCGPGCIHAYHKCRHEYRSGWIHYSRRTLADPVGQLFDS